MKSILTRVLLTIPVVWGGRFAGLLLIHLVPGDPVQQMLGEGATAADLTALRHQYGLDLPLGTQYLHYWRDVLHGDLGRSHPAERYGGAPDRDAVSYTVELTLAALLLGLVLAVPAGVMASVRRGRWTGSNIRAGQPLRAFGPGLRAGTSADTRFFDRSGLAAGFGSRAGRPVYRRTDGSIWSCQR